LNFTAAGPTPGGCRCNVMQLNKLQTGICTGSILHFNVQDTQNLM